MDIMQDQSQGSANSNNRPKQGHIAMRDPLLPVTLGPIYSSGQPDEQEWNGMVYVCQSSNKIYFYIVL